VTSPKIKYFWNLNLLEIYSIFSKFKFGKVLSFIVGGNGTTMLNLADHDSMSGEHVGTTSRMIVTSGKSVIWPLAAPENQGFRKLWKFPREGKDLGKLINSICEEAGRCQVCWENRLLFFLAVMITIEWVWGKRNLLELKDISEEEFFPSSPSWIHGQARGWIGQVILVAYTMVGRNMVVPFAFPQTG